MFHKLDLSLLLLIFVMHLTLIGSLSVDDFLTLTSSQKAKLDEHIRWRSENQIDSILSEDWDDFDREYRIYIEGCDKDGKPVITMFPGDWDIRRVALSGKTKLFLRYLVKLFEEALVTVRAMQESGQNVTQATIICDLAEFNVITNGCPSCIAIYIQLATIYENNYPGLAHRLIGINVPQVALTLWDLLKHFLNPQTTEVLHVYSRDRRSWERALFNEIDRDQLPTKFGGHKTNDSLDLVEYRGLNKVFACT
ncbi:phosphatidylinositol/phosphatidylcholine transfer protein SFH12-like isoform X1 [Folsomia candida]|uniref:phosphatidylinositol/phosphatidylcholine transfer protein SFH12-like isoform X1 n=1 Tax=Folsomia candida TaxID=158441 RepID=UPI0016051039|nr:phosphatidylinositol/phosphatidylcholine transfer protein SFH12-like isoform X1 [Folsomia candida]